MSLLEPGTRVDGRYEVIRLLGQGGMAAVYQVQHLGLQSVHALKVLNPELARNDEVRGRFLTEGRIQARLRHPNIVQVTEIVTAPVAGLIMDYVEGPTLGDFCRAGERPGLTPPVLLEVFLPVLDAVEEAHRHGVVHRDLKPDNILIGKDSRGRLQPRVTDFGIAKVLEEEPGAKKGKTRAGARMGTLLYMAPEQIRGADEVDARADIFALGAILYEAATGQVAFDAESEFDTMRKIVEGTFEPPERVVGHLPPVIGGCIRKALAVDPAERFPSCSSFRAVLERALEEDAPVPAKPSRSYAVTRVGPAPVAPAATPEARARTSTSSSTPAAPGSTPAASTAPSALARPPSSAAMPAASAPRTQSGALPLPPAHQQAVDVLSPRERDGITPNPDTSPGLALALGLCCIPGAAQLYNSQFLKGLTVLGFSVFLWQTNVGLACLAIPVINLLGAIDGFTIASKRRKGQWVSTWESF